MYLNFQPDRTLQNKLETILYSSDISWNIHNSTISSYFEPEFGYDERIMDPATVPVSLIYSDELDYIPQPELWNDVKEILYSCCSEAKLKPIRITRVKANLLVRDPDFTSDKFNIPHRDYEEDDVMSLIYYVNDSDGDTCMFPNYNKYADDLGEPVRFSPIRGRSIIFKSNTYHASSCPINNFRRIVINFCFTYERIE